MAKTVCPGEGVRQESCCFSFEHAAHDVAVAGPETMRPTSKEPPPM